jgi:hypothetical protein
MRNEHSKSHTGTRRITSAARRDDLTDWRRLTRSIILADFLDRTRDLGWSRELIDLLLEELHVSDEFDDLIGRLPSTAQANYPQLVAIALVLRHSWFPEDLAGLIAELGLSASHTAPSVECVPSPEVVAAASRRGFTSHSAPSRRTCTPQKGEERTC